MKNTTDNNIARPRHLAQGFASALGRLWSIPVVLIGALCLTGCLAAAEDDTPSKHQSRFEITVAFETVADAEAAAAAIERMDDGSIVLTSVTRAASFDVLVTDDAQTWLFDQPTLISTDEAQVDRGYEKNVPSCVGNCGEWMDVCGCDDWCVIFGDCCPDYYNYCW